jgi:hypothetical protein
MPEIHTAELIVDREDTTVARMRVPYGWLYQVDQTAPTFVPDPSAEELASLIESIVLAVERLPEKPQGR